MLFSRAARLAPGDLIEVDGRPVRLAVHARARRVSLRIDSARREAVATAPSARRLPEAAAFAQSRGGWIAERLDALPPGQALRPGQVIPFRGGDCRLERAAMRIAPRIAPPVEGEAARLLAWGQDAAYARAAERALRAEALRILTERSRVYAAALGAATPHVAVMDAKARWGSCLQGRDGAPGRIRYAWRLVLAPVEVADYVAAHECAHLVEANHGPRFWAAVRRLFGDPSKARAWLRAHGSELHAIGRG